MARRRLFFALWPDRPVRERIAAYSARVGARGGRSVPSASLHLTLVFLGGVEDALAPALEHAATQVQGRQFSLRLDAPGAFRAARALWLGPAVVPVPLVALEHALQRASAVAGITLAERAFVPHVTLVRNAHVFDPLPGDVAIDWPVQEFVLCASRTESAGARYDVLRRWPLR